MCVCVCVCVCVSALQPLTTLTGLCVSVHPCYHKKTTVTTQRWSIQYSRGSAPATLPHTDNSLCVHVLGHGSCFLCQKRQSNRETQYHPDTMTYRIKENPDLWRDGSCQNKKFCHLLSCRSKLGWLYFFHWTQNEKIERNVHIATKTCFECE